MVTIMAGNYIFKFHGYGPKVLKNIIVMIKYVYNYIYCYGYNYGGK